MTIAAEPPAPEAANARPAGSGRDDAAPRYVEIKRSITDALHAGTLKPGDRVPSEAELVARFGVSRMTANRALRELSDAGVVTRRAGAGSFIAEPRPIGQIVEIRNIAEEVRARGHAYRARVVTNDATRADDVTGDLLEVDPGTPLFHSVIVHHEAEAPIQLEERHVLASVAPGYGDTDFHGVTPNEYLTRIAPIDRVEHRICAAMPDAATCRLLAMAQDEPVLVMTRRTWSAGRLVSFARLTHPATRFELTAAFSVDRS